MQIGQEITIPVPKPKSTTTTQKTNTAKAPVTLGADQYKIVSGDTLGKIAKKFKVTVSDLKRANNLDSDAIRVGQILKIPAASAQKTVTLNFFAIFPNVSPETILYWSAPSVTGAFAVFVF